MNKSEIINQLQGTSIEERLLMIEAILQTIKNDMHPTFLQRLPGEYHSLKGKLICYDHPYEPVADEDWEALI